MGNPDAGSGNYTAPDASARRVHLVVPLEMAGLRLDQALARLLPEQSRSRLAKLIADGHVLVDGNAAAGAKKMRSGEALDVTLMPRPEEAAFRAEALEIPLLHEDAEVLVVDKPAGLVVHPGSGNWAGTMLNALLHHAPQLKHLPRAGIVHRLDKETSGLLVVGKTEAAQLDLIRQLQARTVKRTYIAVVRGRVARAGTVDAPIGRHPVKRTRMAVVSGGKPAVTHYRVKESFAAHTLLECDLETGRTHQIRVHLASIGHPLEGDPEYGAKGERRLERQALHAWRLAFLHPRTKQPLQFESPVPADIEALLASLRAA
jgi:23S rRNA pseudouridine1911/1915/1917 synthase